MLRAFLFISLITISCTYLAVQLLLFRQSSNIIENFKHEAELALAAGKSVFTRDMEEIHSDLFFLSEQIQFQNMSKNIKNDSSLNQIENTFQLFSQNKKRYDQIRYIDAHGNERIRINNETGKATIVPTKKLQNKRHRYYFTETMTLKSGEIYISPFDLNIENNHVEVPLT
jgi:hypothetical protein